MLACKTDEVILGLEVEAWMLTNASFSFLALFLFLLLGRLLHTVCQMVNQMLHYQEFVLLLLPF